METITITVLLGTLALCLVQTSLACNGYRLKVNHFRNCNSNSIIKIEKFSLKLDKDCNIVPSGCISTTKRFESGKVHYMINKPPLPAMEGDADLCEAIKTSQDDSTASITKMFSLPTQCPVNASKQCGDPSKKINIGSYKNRLAMFAGNLTFKADITHNNGVSCIDVHITLEKPRQG